jgi:hypothetical protein
MPYHLTLMVVTIGLFLLSMYLLFVNPDKQKAFMAALVAGLNYILCIVVSFGFFRIGLIGSDNTITAYIDMMPFYAIFFLLHWFSIAQIFYSYWHWVKNPLSMDVVEDENVKVQTSYFNR